MPDIKVKSSELVLPLGNFGLSDLELSDLELSDLELSDLGLAVPRLADSCSGNSSFSVFGLTEDVSARFALGAVDGAISSVERAFVS